MYESRCGFCSGKEFEHLLKQEKKMWCNISRPPAALRRGTAVFYKHLLCTTAIFSWFSHLTSQPIVTARLQEEWIGPEVSCDHSLHCTCAPSGEGVTVAAAFIFIPIQSSAAPLWCFLPSLSFLLCFDDLLLQAQVRSRCDELPQSNVLLVTGTSAVEAGAVLL